MYRIGSTVFVNWTIVRKIGEGSFGAVYELQREDFGEVYSSALKVIRVPSGDGEVQALQREGMDQREIQRYLYSSVSELVREFALMAKLKGTGHIVSYEDHTVLKHDSGIGWDILIRMELLTPLLTYAYQDHPFSRRDVIKLGIDICKALELCQKYNIIHRDIKPDNIFVNDNGDFKLGDFGIARTVEKTQGEMSKKGTYNYMAPEVYRGEEYGFSVDIYSLGIVLYRLLNRNRLPFLPQPPQPLTHDNRDRALASRMSGRAIPSPWYGQGRLGEIVLKACTPNPQDRYGSPMQMRQELEAILYDSNDAQLIYPQGDALQIQKNEYITGSRKKDPTIEEETRAEEPTRKLSGHPAAQTRKDKTQKGKYADSGKPKKKKKSRIPVTIALLLAAAFGVGIFLARFRGAEAAKETEYLQLMQQAQEIRQKDPDQALKRYQQAMDLFPEEEDPHIAYAYTLYSAGQYDSCVTYIEDDLAMGKGFSLDAQNQLCQIQGAAYFERGDYAAAASFFRLSTAGGSITVDAMRDYAVSLGRLGDIAAAADILSQMRSAGATGAATSYVQAELDYVQKHYLLAEEGFRGVMSASSDAALQRRALRTLAQLYKDCAQLEDSPIENASLKEIALLESGIRTYHLEYDSSLVEMLGWAYFNAAVPGDPGQAEYLHSSADCFSKVIAQGIHKDYLYRNLFTVYYQLKEYDNAEMRLQQYQEQFPEDYMPHALRGLMLIAMESDKPAEQRSFDEALKAYETAGTMIRSDDDQSYYLQLESYIRQLRENNWIG